MIYGVLFDLTSCREEYWIYVLASCHEELDRIVSSALGHLALSWEYFINIKDLVKDFILHVLV